jgi:hypothetical protein
MATDEKIRFNEMKDEKAYIARRQYIMAALSVAGF